MSKTRKRALIRKRFRTLRVLRDLTQIQASVAAKMALTRYREIENGYYDPTDEETVNLCRAFKVDRLFDDEPEAPNATEAHPAEARR